MRNNRRMVALCSFLLLMIAPFAVSAEIISYDGTYETTKHGFVYIRSFDDCKMHVFGRPDEGDLSFQYSAIAGKRQTVRVVSDTRGGSEALMALKAIANRENADDTCVIDLGTHYLEGNLSNWTHGNASGQFDLKLSGGRRATFFFDNDLYPTIRAGVGLHCDPSTCSAAHKHVRVTYRTETTGDGASLVVLLISPL